MYEPWLLEHVWECVYVSMCMYVPVCKCCHVHTGIHMYTCTHAHIHSWTSFCGRMRRPGTLLRGSGAGLPHGTRFLQVHASDFHRTETTKVMMGLIMREIIFKVKETIFFLRSQGQLHIFPLSEDGSPISRSMSLLIFSNDTSKKQSKTKEPSTQHLEQHILTAYF